MKTFKTTFTILTAILVANLGFAAEAPTTFQTDGVRTGKQSSVLDKYYEFNTNDGAANPRLSVKNSDKQMRSSTNRLIIGNGSATGNKALEANLGLGSNPDIRYNVTTSVWEFSHDGITWSELGSGGGGLTDSGDLERTLFDAELGTSLPKHFNQIFDTYSSSKGTLSNVTVGSSKLSLTAGQTAGSQIRSKQLTKEVGTAQAITTVASQAVAPKATTIVSNTIKFDGDVCEFFPASKNVVVVKEFTSDGEMVHQYLKNADNHVALLQRSSCSYASGPNESTLVLANPEALDLDFDLSAASYMANLRVIPFDVQLESKGTSAGAYTALDLLDASTTGTLRIPAEVIDAFTARATTLSGSAIRFGLNCSPNGTYCMGAVLEHLAANAYTWHFYTSATNGTTFQKAAYTQPNPSGGTIVEDTLFGYMPNPTVIVANNGKAFALFSRFEPTYSYGSMGVYTDISIATPIVTDTPAFSDGANAPGTAGVICDTTANDRGYAVGDTTDLSFIAVACMKQDDTIRVEFFTAGGATRLGSDTTGYSHKYGSRPGMVMTGTGSSHRTFLYNQASANLSYKYWDQPSTSPVANLVAFVGDYYVYDCRTGSSKAYCLIRDNADDTPKYFSFSLTGSPTLSSLHTLNSQLKLDEILGSDGVENSPSDTYNYGRLPGPMIYINPLDNNQVLFSADMIHPDGYRRAAIFEVRDDTTFSGTSISQYTTGGTQDLRRNTGAPPNSIDLAQTITITTQRIRGIGFKMLQIGNYVPYGYPVTLEVQATTGGLPNGTVLCSAQNTYEANDVTVSGSYMWGHWTFSNCSPGAGVYAFVIKSTYPITATNGEVQFQCSTNSSAYAGGDAYRYDGSAWQVTGSDLVFELDSDWIYNMAQATDQRIGRQGMDYYDQESSINVSGNGQIAHTHRSANWALGAGQKRKAGHTFKSLFSLGSGSAASTFTALAPVGYATTKFNQHMIFMTQPGTTDSATKDVVTGVTTDAAEDRSGVMHVTGSYTGTSFVTDVSMDSGKALQFNSTNASVDYGNATDFNIARRGSKFAIEAQFKLNTLPSVKGFASMLASKIQNGTPNPGWAFGVNASNRLEFTFYSPNVLTTGSTTTFTTGVAYRVRVTGDGTTVRLYVHNGTTWVEEAYSAQNTTAYDYNNSDFFLLGNIQSAVIYGLGGNLGYIKIMRGSDTFVDTGYNSQGSFTQPINAGGIVALGLDIGLNTGTVNSSYNYFGTAPISGGSSSVVDSYEDNLLWSKELDAPGNLLHYRLDVGRGSDRNALGVYGTILRGY